MWTPCALSGLEIQRGFEEVLKSTHGKLVCKQGWIVICKYSTFLWMAQRLCACESFPFGEAIFAKSQEIWKSNFLSWSIMWCPAPPSPCQCLTSSCTACASACDNSSIFGATKSANSTGGVSHGLCGRTSSGIAASAAATALAGRSGRRIWQASWVTTRAEDNHDTAWA